ncbi:glutathione transferase GST 23-like [Actinidia eriantha]|uniref:glutathione transferase GST 23-like n=1 Tax=Actinidia eriantha TaxID=165200 RepID=UPI002590A71B|nr:glutathione transferase GST 23-like [Actinidia eriantha]
MEEEVKLFGTSRSPFSYRVIWALKLKGIPYQYVEEDLSNKSPLLLQYNPVHKKIPVLVHCGKPICESMLILQYIEEIWPHINPLLPTDPHDRAMARFWVKYSEDKGLVFFNFFSNTGEAQEKAAKEVLEVLRTLEEQGLGDKKFFGGNSMGLVDISFGWLCHWFDVMEEVVGIKLLESNTFPKLHAWVQNLKEVAVIKENLPDREKLLAYFKSLREKFVADLSNQHA